MLNLNTISPHKATQKKISEASSNVAEHIFIWEQQILRSKSVKLYMGEWLALPGTEIDVYTPLFNIRLGEPPYNPSQKFFRTTINFLATGNGLFYPVKFEGEEIKNGDILYITYKDDLPEKF